MKKPFLHIDYLSPKVSTQPLSVEKMFMASVTETSTHENYDSTDLFE